MKEGTHSPADVVQQPVDVRAREADVEGVPLDAERLEPDVEDVLCEGVVSAVSGRSESESEMRWGKMEMGMMGAPRMRPGL